MLHAARFRVSHEVQQVGAEERHRNDPSQSTRRAEGDRFLRRWTAAPIGRIITAATRCWRSDEEGLTPNSRINIGRHQRAATGAGHADEEADDRAPRER